MKKIILFSVVIALMATSFAQPINPKSIEDSVIGWMKVYNFKGAKAPMKVDAKNYSIAQLSICDSLANWMQASYLPKGGLGDIKKTLSEKLGLYNQYTAGKPQSYGASSKTYNELKYNSSGKMELFTSANVWWGVFANNIPGGWAVTFICTPTQYYFTLPTAETEVADEKIKKLLDVSKNANIKPYISFWVKNLGFGRGVEHVLLCKDNKSPFIKITKGEFLQALEMAITVFYEKEKKTIYEAEQGKQQRMVFPLKQLDEKIDRFRAGLTKNKEKYKNRLSELAIINSSQPSLNDLDGRDVFSNRYLTDPESNSAGYPVYKVDPVMAELCKKDKPQWILVSWEFYDGDPIEEQQHEAIINNFNFDYVYNFFFDPEKVKNQPYKPLRSLSYKEAVVVTEASEATKKNNTDKNIFFFEDFSTTVVGKIPIGWKSKIGSGNSRSVVTNLDGLGGNWAVVADYTLTPTQIKKPLPQNFTLSFDVVVTQNFTWGAKRLRFKLAKENSVGNAESFLELGIRPGFGGSGGEVSLETKFPSPPGYSNLSNAFVAPGFSNNKKNNRITVTLKKMEEILQVFVDNNKIAEYEKAIPAAHLFNALSFYSYNSGANDKFYISNIKITRN